MVSLLLFVVIFFVLPVLVIVKTVRNYREKQAQRYLALCQGMRGL